MMRAIHLLFALACYAFGVAMLVYLICFVGNLPYVPVTIDNGPIVPLGTALVIDVALIALFGVQHSVMARPGFKQAWTRMVPAKTERNFYVLATGLVLALFFYLWRPIGGVVWSVEGAGATVLWAVFWMGWAITFLTTFLINHFELFGLQQAWSNRPIAPKFVQPLLYRMMRHPLYFGLLLGFWATPLMTWGHVLFAAGMTAYILLAIRYEERDLTVVFGEEYRVCQTRVGMLIPGIGKQG